MPCAAALVLLFYCSTSISAHIRLPAQIIAPLRVTTTYFSDNSWQDAQVSLWEGNQRTILITGVWCSDSRS